MRVLVDASTLIALATAGRLDLLREVFGKVHATTAVLAEAVVPGRPGSRAIEAAGWIVAVEAPVGPTGALGPGEASMLAIAADDLLVLDDRAARVEARSRGLRVTGVLGVLLHGTRTGMIDKARARHVLEVLARGPFRMSVDLYDDVRRRLA